MPTVIDGLTDLVEIGRGGFGTVYRARQIDLGRSVAVKVLPDVRGDSEAYARFARECQALAALGGHPNIATVFGCGLTDDGSGYLSMELLPGGSLASKIEEGPLPWHSVATWGVLLSGALETAHRSGITHRDVKPENVLFDGLGIPKLVDFGIATVPGAYRTATGAMSLTVAHAAPEVIAGGRGGVSADVYSLASSLYAALAGQPAFVARTDETMVPMLARIATAPVPDLRPSGVPGAVCAALENGMAKDPADRPASAEAFGMALHDALVSEGVAAPAPPLLLPGMGAIAFVAASAPSSTPSPGYTGDRTVTGLDAAAAAEDASVRTASTAPELPGRWRWNGWAIVAGLAVVALGIVAFRGVGAVPAVVGAAPSSLATPSPFASGTPSPSATLAPSTSHPASPLAAITTPAADSSSNLPSPQSTRSVSPSPGAAIVSRRIVTPPIKSAAPPPPTSAQPAVPTTVRASAATVAKSANGTSSKVTLTVSWHAPVSGPVPTLYEVRWVVVGGPDNGTATSAPATSALSERVTVPAPSTSSWYRWQVRSRNGSALSGWVTVHVVMFNAQGRRVAAARTALRALGLTSTTYKQPTSDPAQVGFVLAQSLPRGSIVVAGSSLALGVGAPA